MNKFEKYNKDLEYSYTFGVFPTFELIKNKPESVVCILLSSKLKDSPDTQKLKKLIEKNKIEIIVGDKQIEKLSPKENCYAVGVFKKYSCTLDGSKRVVLDNISDMGNLGTIIRTSLGFGITNIALISPCADHFNPKTIRASMGAIFSVNLQVFESLEQYLKVAKTKNYFFMLSAKKSIDQTQFDKTNFSLIFGNEAHGIDNKFLGEDSVVIKHLKTIDSLNLPSSVAIAEYVATKGNFDK